MGSELELCPRGRAQKQSRLFDKGLLCRIAHGCFIWICCWYRAVFRSEPCHKLGDLFVTQGVFEGRHLLATVFNLISNLRRFPGLSYAVEGRALGRTCAGRSVAVCAALIVEEVRPRLLSSPGFRSEECVGEIGCNHA